MSTKDSNNDFISFQEVGLIKIKDEIFKEDVLLLKEHIDYNYFYEIFDNRYLIVSVQKKGLTTWSGWDTVPKDSVLITDIAVNVKNIKTKYFSLQKAFFARNKEELTNKYDYSENIKLNTNYTYHYAIEDIKFDKNELLLIHPDLTVKKYILK